MSGIRRLSYVLLISAAAMLWGCHAAPPEGEGTPAKGGVFADVIAAVETVNTSIPDPGERDSDVPRGEWKLILDARQRFTVPRIVSDYSAETDYYEPEEADTAGSTDMTRGDALDVILDAEWDEYTTPLELGSFRDGRPAAGKGTPRNRSRISTGTCRS